MGRLSKVFLSVMVAGALGAAMALPTQQAEASVGKKIAEKAGDMAMHALLDGVEKGVAALDEGEEPGFVLNLLRDNKSESIEKILETVTEIEKDVDEIKAQLKDGFNEVNTLQHYIDYSNDIDAIQQIDNEIDTCWDLYEVALAAYEAKVEAGQTVDINDSVFQAFRAQMARLDFNDKFSKLDATLTAAAGELTVYSNLLGVLEIRDPFQHQGTQPLLNLYGYATGVQLKLLVLYGEHVAALGAVATDAYDAQYDAVGDSIAQQWEGMGLESRSHLACSDENGEFLADNVNTTLTNGLRTYPAYRVVSNGDGEAYVIVKPTFGMKQFVAESSSPNYIHSSAYEAVLRSTDAMYSLGRNARDLAGLFANMPSGTNYADWLTVDGGLQMDSQMQLFLIDKIDQDDQNSARQYSVRATNTKDLNDYEFDDYLVWEYKHIFKNSKSYAFPGSGSVGYGDSQATLIYRSGSSADTLIQPVSVTELQGIQAVGQGQTLDLSHLPSDIAAGNIDIYLSGNATVCGDAAKTVSGIRFILTAGADVTMSDVNIVGRPNTDVVGIVGYPHPALAVIDLAGDAAITMHGSVSVSAPNSGDINFCLLQSAISTGQHRLTLSGDAVLTVTGMQDGAGIHVPSGGVLDLSGLTLVARTEDHEEYNPSYPDYRGYGAAIGAIGSYGSELLKEQAGCGTINISNATVTTWHQHHNGFADDIGYWLESTSTEDLKGLQLCDGGLIKDSTLNLEYGYINNAIAVENCTFTGKMEYQLDLKTLDIENAGSDCKLLMDIVGMDGTAVRDIDVKQAVKDYGAVSNPMQRDSLNRFVVFAPDAGDIDYIELHTEGTDAWCGEYLKLRTAKNGFADEQTFMLYEWLKKSSKRAYPGSYVHEFTVNTFCDTDSGSDAKIGMKVSYIDTRDGQLKETGEVILNDYIAGNAFQKNASDTFRLNFSMMQSLSGIGADIQSVSVQAHGTDAWHLASIKVKAIQGEVDNVVSTDEVYADQWLQVQDFWHEFSLGAGRDASKQYRITAKTSGKGDSATDAHIRYAIGESRDSMTGRLWASHNVSGNSMKKGQTDEFNVCWERVVEQVNVLRLDSEGSDKWRPEYIEVQRIHDGVAFGPKYRFDCNGAFFEKKNGDQWFENPQITSYAASARAMAAPAAAEEAPEPAASEALPAAGALRTRGTFQPDAPASVYSGRPFVVTGRAAKALDALGAAVELDHVDGEDVVQYSWTLDPAKLDAGGLEENGRFYTAMWVGSLGEAGLGHLGLDRATGILMLQKSDLPGAAGLRVHVPEYAPGTVLDLYGVSGGQLAGEPSASGIVVDQEGYASFDLSRAQNYVLVEAGSTAGSSTAYRAALAPTGDALPAAALGGIAALAVLAGGLVALSRKRG